MTAPVGLCADCAFARVVRTRRGSTFYLCERSREEPHRYSRYPRLPVLRCGGHEPRADEASAD